MTNTTPRFTPNFIQVTPFMIVNDLEKALAFFVDLLDFEVQLRASDYAYVQRETAGFRIWQQTGKNAAPPGTRRPAYYIDVHDVDRPAHLWPRHRQALYAYWRLPHVTDWSSAVFREFGPHRGNSSATLPRQPPTQ